MISSATERYNVMTLTVCIPMYNESSVIKDTALKLTEYLNLHFPNDYELIFSDDGSTDGSADIVNGLNLPFVHVVGYAQNRGKGAAVRNAVLSSKGDIVLFTDADLAYGTEIIGTAVHELQRQKQTDVMIGSRNLDKKGYQGYTFIRRIASKIYIRILCIVGGLKFSDSQCGLKLFRSKPAIDIFKRCDVDGFAFDFEVILWAQTLKFHISELPVRILNHRESKIHLFRDTFQMLHDVIGIRKRVNKRYKSEKHSS